MVIVQDQRPRDWVYKVAFKEKDLPSLQEMVKHIQDTHDTDMIEDFNAKCEQKLAGEKATFNGLELQEVIKTDDLVTNPGLQQCINLILFTSSTRYTHIIASRSSSNISPAVTDTTLNTGSGGPYVLPLATYGWSEPKGMKMFFGTLVFQDSATSGAPSTINEMAVYSGALMTNVMLNHETFFNNNLARTITPDLAVYANVFILSCVVEFCPVA